MQDFKILRKTFLPKHVNIFFFFGLYKRATVVKSHIMEKYTSQGDDLYQEANEIEYLDYIPPCTSCYKNWLEFEEIIVKAKKMESTARDIQKKF